MQRMYEPQFETMQRNDLEQLQVERLQSTLHRVYRNVAFYHHSFDDRKIDIENIRDIKDLHQLPFTTKDDLRRSYPYNMFAVPLRDIVRLHASSGTTGKPIVVGYTKNDITRWSQLVARLLVSAGLTEHDVVQIALHYSLFTGGLGFHYGAELLGASVVPVSTGSNLEEQLLIMRDYKTTSLLSMPSYALSIINKMEDMGFHPETLGLRCGIFGAEPWSEQVRSHIEENLHIDAYDSYGLSELIGPGVAGECHRKNGLHVNEDNFIVEVIDPVTGTVRGPGETGELVFTTIAKEGFPLIRYRTGDLGCVLEGVCECGRTFKRMSRIQGRTDDQVMAQGTKFFPSQVQEILLALQWVDPLAVIVIDRRNGNDTIEIRTVLSEDAPFFDEISKITEFRKSMIQKFETALGINAQIVFSEAASLKDAAGRKGIQVIDKRNL